MIPNAPLLPRPRAPSNRPGAQRRRRARVLAAAALAAAALMAGACADDPARPPADALDAGAASCERGTDGCACIGGSGCRDGLLCIAGRCLTAEQQPPGDEPSRPSRPPPLRPPPEVPDASAPGVAQPDGGPSPLDAGDAGSGDAG